MSRTIVVYCIKALTLTLIWAVALETIAVLFSLEIDLTAVLTFAAAASAGSSCCWPSSGFLQKRMIR